MSNMFSKHFHLCFFKLKYPTITTADDDADVAATATPHPKQSSSSHSPSSSTVASLFNHPLYDSADDLFSSSSDSEARDDPPQPPDFASVFASQRFFFSSPGLSNSIVESPDTRPITTTTTLTTKSSLVAGGSGVGVSKYSLNPYLDFRRSMQEMIESRPLVDVREDWDYLYDLLLCYLALNPSHTHRYIVRAFTDLVIHFLSSPAPSSAPETTFCRKKPNTRRHKSFSGRLL